MWALDVLEGALGTWNSYMAQIWDIVTQSPKEFMGGAIWPAIEQIFSVLQGIGYGLLILFFAMSFFKQSTSFRELRTRNRCSACSCALSSRRRQSPMGWKLSILYSRSPAGSLLP